LAVSQLIKLDHEFFNIAWSHTIYMRPFTCSSSSSRDTIALCSTLTAASMEPPNPLSVAESVASAPRPLCRRNSEPVLPLVTLSIPPNFSPRDSTESLQDQPINLSFLQALSLIKILRDNVSVALPSTTQTATLYDDDLNAILAESWSATTSTESTLELENFSTAPTETFEEECGDNVSAASTSKTQPATLYDDGLNTILAESWSATTLAESMLELETFEEECKPSSGDANSSILLRPDNPAHLPIVNSKCRDSIHRIEEVPSMTIDSVMINLLQEVESAPWSQYNLRVGAPMSAASTYS
jgi:hypothetical protein